MVYFLILLAAIFLIHINTDLAAIVGVLMVLCAFVVAVVFWISLTIRRFHDIDKSGYYILWLLVPLSISTLCSSYCLNKEQVPRTVTGHRLAPPSISSLIQLNKDSIMCHHTHD